MYNARPLPELPRDKQLRVHVDANGVNRNLFWIKYNKSGDIFTASYADYEWIARGTSTIENGNIVVAPVPDVVTTNNGPEVQHQKYITIHPSRNEPGKGNPAINGPGRIIQEIGIDLRTIVQTQELMIHEITSPDRYRSEPVTGKYWIKYDGIFNDYAPRFVIRAIPIKFNASGHVYCHADLPSSSHEILTNITTQLGFRVMLSINVEYGQSDIFPNHHAILVPSGRS